MDGTTLHVERRDRSLSVSPVGVTRVTGPKAGHVLGANALELRE
jgi:hypothetical protein